VHSKAGEPESLVYFHNLLMIQQTGRLHAGTTVTSILVKGDTVMKRTRLLYSDLLS